MSLSIGKQAMTRLGSPKWKAGAGAIVICLGMIAAPTFVTAQQSPDSIHGLWRVTPEKLALAGRLSGLMQVAGANAIEAQGIMPDTTRHATLLDIDTKRVLGEWTTKYLPPDSIVAIRSRVLATHFSTQELQGLVAFFTSPLGERFVGAQTTLLHEEAAETEKLLAPHRQELRTQLLNVVRQIRRRN